MKRAGREVNGLDSREEGKMGGARKGKLETGVERRGKGGMKRRCEDQKRGDEAR